MTPGSSTEQVMTRPLVADRPAPERAIAAPRAYVLVPVFTIVAFLMTYRSIGKLDTHIIGNSGDPLLILWILGWVQHAIPHGWGTIWNTSMFFPEQNTLAYSDSLLSVAIVGWPLRALFGQTLGLNLLTLAAQTASLWFMYLLALRLTRSWPASVVAAFAFAFSTPLMSHIAHYQLALTSFLVPLTMLLLVRYLEAWQLRFGIGVGLALAALTTSATYFGLMIACALPVIVLGYLVWYRPKPVWAFLRGLVAGAAVAAVLTIPVAIQYMKLQDDPYFRRVFDPSVAAHPSDFLSPDQDNYLLTELWPFEDHAFDRTVENRLFPGIVMTGFGILGVVVMVRGLRRRRATADEVSRASGPPTVDDRWRSRVGLLTLGGGLVGVVMAFGDEMTIAGSEVSLPFKFMREHVPGFSGIRSTSRFVVIGVCAFAICTAFGVAALLRRVHRGAATVLIAALCVLVIGETAISLPHVRVPDTETDEAVYRFLDRRPDGVVVELPIRGPADGTAWAYLESPRQLASLADDKDRVNGFSGYGPEGFENVVSVLNGFPRPSALNLLDERDVRYVVLRTRVLGEQLPEFAAVLNEDGYGRYTPETARALIGDVPRHRLGRVTALPGAYVVELRPPP
jgi:hypothetical protein